MIANELRIGNWILNGIGEKFEANGYTICYFHNVLGSFEPIPLKKKWIKKFGLDEQEMIELRKICNWYETDIEYVHQLQNIYFAITGEELELNDNL